MNKNVLNYLLDAAQLLYISASSHWELVFALLAEWAAESVKEAVKLLAMPLFYRLYKDIITQHIVY